MKLSMIACVVSLVAVVGCASHPHPYDTNTASNAKEETALGQPSDPCVQSDVPCKKDAYDVAADYATVGANVGFHAAADAGRWIWNEATKAYDWSQSQEAKDDYKKAQEKFDALSDALKDYAKDAEKAVKKP